MKPLAVIIPSRNASNLVQSVAAVRQHEPDARIIVVDDGIDWQDLPVGIRAEFYSVLLGVKPFIFARNVNIGIRAAGDSDVVLLNDDALLESPGGFRLMQEATEAHSDVGVIGAVTNVTGAAIQQVRHGGGFRYVDHIAFVCVLIPARTREALSTRSRMQEADRQAHMEKCAGDCIDPSHPPIHFTGGFLDERYTTYGWEDNDYIRQCKTAGLRIAVHDGCFVNHGKLPSTFRGPGGPGGDIEPGRKIYMAKWPGFRQ